MSRPAAPRAGIVMPLAEQRGGAELALVHFLAGVERSRRNDIFVCYLQEGPLVQWTRAQGFATVVIPSGRLRELWSWLRCMRALRRWLKQNGIKVVVSWMPKGHLYAGPAALLSGVPAMWWQHGVPRNRGLDLAVTLLPARRVLACSRAAACAQQRLLFQRTELRTIYPPVDLERLGSIGSTQENRARLGLPSGRLIVGIVARLQRWKGVHVLLAAARELLNSRQDLLFVVVGGPHPLEPEYAASLEQRSRQLQLQDHVLFTGYQVNAAQWMAAMDVIVNASFGEPFGMVIIEAMALGKAVVATRRDGPTEIITDGVDGLLVGPGSVAELVEAIRRLLEEPELRAALGRAGRLRAQSYAVPRFVLEVTNSLQEISA
jgi:glycosyltransferase involved in cell wall biosynthesis